MRVGTGTLSGCVTCEGGRGRGGQVDKLDIRTSCKRQDSQDSQDRVKKDNRKILISSDQ